MNVKRRKFISTTSAGLLASLILPSFWAVENRSAEKVVKTINLAQSSFKFRDFKKILFCGTPKGKREIFLANLENVLS